MGVSVAEMQVFSLNMKLAYLALAVIASLCICSLQVEAARNAASSHVSPLRDLWSKYFSQINQEPYNRETRHFKRKHAIAGIVQEKGLEGHSNAFIRVYTVVSVLFAGASFPIMVQYFKGSFEWKWGYVPMIILFAWFMDFYSILEFDLKTLFFFLGFIFDFLNAWAISFSLPCAIGWPIFGLYILSIISVKDMDKAISEKVMGSSVDHYEYGLYLKSLLHQSVLIAGVSAIYAKNIFKDGKSFGISEALQSCIGVIIEFYFLDWEYIMRII
jgi:hypothetical protein